MGARTCVSVFSPFYLFIIIGLDWKISLLTCLFEVGEGHSLEVPFFHRIRRLRFLYVATISMPRLGVLCEFLVGHEFHFHPKGVTW